MDTIPPELYIRIAKFYVSSSISIFPGDWSLTGEPVSIAQVLQDAPLHTHLRGGDNISRISATPSGDASPFTLCHVNSRFRRITLAEPSLWSFLSIRNPRKAELVHRWLRCLQKGPLYLDLYLNYDTGPVLDLSLNDSRHPARQILKSLLEIAPQWKAARLAIARISGMRDLFIKIPAGLDIAPSPPPSDKDEEDEPIDDGSEQDQDQEPEQLYNPPSEHFDFLSSLDCTSMMPQSPAAFHNLESLATHHSPRLSELKQGYAPTLRIKSYYPLIYAPNLKYMHWDHPYVPHWVTAPRNLQSKLSVRSQGAPRAGKLLTVDRWKTMTELTLVGRVTGGQAYTMLQKMEGLRRFAPLGGLVAAPWGRDGGDGVPVPGEHPNAFPTNESVESGVQELVISTQLLAFYALVQFVKFPRLRLLRIDKGALMEGVSLASLDNAREPPSMLDRPTAVQLIIEGRDREDVAIEVVERGISKQI